MDRAVDLRHLRYALAVADAGSVTRAARLLGIAQPPLSAQLGQLEAELGVRLFDRGRHGATATEAGRVFADGARAVLAAVDTLRDDARRAARGEVGRVRVGYLAALFGDLLPAAVRRLRDARPGVEVVVEDMTEVEQLRALADDAVDVALLVFPPRGAAAREIAAARVATEPLGVLLPAGHRLARGARHRAVRLDAFAGADGVAIGARSSPDAFAMLRGMYRRAGIARTLEVDRAAALVDLVAAGLGVAVVPRALGARAAAAAAAVAYRPMLAPRAAVAFHVAWRKASERPAVHALVALLRDASREAP